MPSDTHKSTQDVLRERFDDIGPLDTLQEDIDPLFKMAARGAKRRFQAKPISDDLVEVLCGVALSSPTKSDLQQRDIILLKSPAKRAALASLVADQSWVKDAPAIAIFCGNNRRQRILHEIHNLPFANDHLDAFFNAVVSRLVQRPTVKICCAQGCFSALMGVALRCVPFFVIFGDC